MHINQSCALVSLADFGVCRQCYHAGATTRDRQTQQAQGCLQTPLVPVMWSRRSLHLQHAVDAVNTFESLCGYWNRSKRSLGSEVLQSDWARPTHDLPAAIGDRQAHRHQQRPGWICEQRYICNLHWLLAAGNDREIAAKPARPPRPDAGDPTVKARWRPRKSAHDRTYGSCTVLNSIMHTNDQLRLRNIYNCELLFERHPIQFHSGRVRAFQVLRQHDHIRCISIRSGQRRLQCEIYAVSCRQSLERLARPNSSTITSSQTCI